MNLADKLKETAQNDPQKVAIEYRKDDHSWERVSYQRFFDDIQMLAGFLRQKGIQKGDRIAIVMENRYEWPLVFFAIVSCCAVVVPINPETDKKEIENILNNSESTLSFTGSGEIFEKCKTLSVKTMKEILCVDEKYFKQILKGEFSEFSLDRLCADDLACLMYTSGTTDDPKGVMLTHENFLSNIESIASIRFITPRDRNLCFLPLHHAFPLTGTMLLPLCIGGTIIFPGSVRSEILFKVMKESRPTIFAAVPQIYYTLSQKISEHIEAMPEVARIIIKMLMNFFYKIRIHLGLNFNQWLLISLHRKFGGHLRYMVSGGAKLNEEVERDLFKYGFNIIEGYGLTETTPVLTVNPPACPKIGSAGKPIKNVELKIDKPNDQGIGEILARGPNIMKGYYKRTDLTEQVIHQSWFHTGDLGYMDQDGYLFITGRAKEVIVLSSGLNIFPDEVEEAYIKGAPIKEMCVFDISVKKDPSDRLALWAILVPEIEFFKKYGEMNLHSVIKERLDNVSRDLPPFKRIMGFTISMDPLPRTLLGKLKRFKVKEKYESMAEGQKKQKEEQKGISKDDEHLMEEDIGRRVIDFLKKQTDAKKILPADLLELDLGIDSLGRVELATGLEKEFKIKIDDQKVNSVFSVKDLIIAVKEHLADPATRKAEAETEVKNWREILEILPKEENREKIDLHPGFGAWLFGFILCRLIFWPFFKIFYHLKVTGQEHIPRKGPCLFYVNHTSFFDGPLMAVSFDRVPRLDIFFLGFRPYFNVIILRNLIKIGRVIPLDFVSHLLEALRNCYYILDRGKCLCLFPEGMRTLDGKIISFKKGFGILAKESQATLVPVYIKGAYQAWPRTKKYPALHQIEVCFGAPQDPKDLAAQGSKMNARDEYEAICRAAQQTLIDMQKEKEKSQE